MMDNILVSVLMPTYNVENFILDAMASIQNQSYNNFEIVVVDDGSTDTTYEILETLQITEPRLRLFKNEVNSGIVKTLNFGISQCRGEYIMRMDGDDLCHYRKMENQLNFLLSNENIHLVGCDIYSIDENDNVLNKIETCHSLFCTKKILKYTCPVLHIWMCKKELYTKLGGYRDLGGSEDYDFLLRIASMGYNFTNLSYYGYSVRIREGNTQSSNGLMQRKIVYYIRRLYRERLSTKSNIDSFNENDKLKYLTSNKFHRKLHETSVKFTNKAMIYRMNRRYILFFIFASLSIISPYQLLFFIETYYSKFLVKRNNVR